MNASVIQGRMNLPAAIDCQIESPISRPDDGAHPSLYQKKYSRSWPSQKTGMETPIRANTMPARSQIEPLRTAEMMPIGTPIASQITAAPTASVIVTGSRR